MPSNTPKQDWIDEFVESFDNAMDEDPKPDKKNNKAISIMENNLEYFSREFFREDEQYKPLSHQTLSVLASVAEGLAEKGVTEVTPIVTEVADVTFCEDEHPDRDVDDDDDDNGDDDEDNGDDDDDEEDTETTERRYKTRDFHFLAGVLIYISPPSDWKEKIPEIEVDVSELEEVN